MDPMHPFPKEIRLVSLGLTVEMKGTLNLNLLGPKDKELRMRDCRRGISGVTGCETIPLPQTRSE